MYGIDVHCPSTNPKDDPWQPVMKNKYVRELYHADDLIAKVEAIRRGNHTVQLRVVEVTVDETQYSL